MNQNQELKMQLLKEFGMSTKPETVDFCREAYKFITETDPKDSPSPAKGGLPASSTEITAVDLGLPSGTLWADRNLGAKSPSDYGAFVTWGNTDLHFPDKGDVDWGDSDDAFDGNYFDYDEYMKTEGGRLAGNIDAAHDAATVNLGESWRMPTSDDFLELYDNCDWVRKTLNGVNGYLVTSKINGNSIFFACSGLGAGAQWKYRGTGGYYWSASFDSERDAFYLGFYSSGVNPQNSSNRCNGRAVRPVQNIIPQK